MQLKSPEGHMVVDFYPCMTADGHVSPNFIVKHVKYYGIETISRSIITRKALREEANSRIHGYGYSVTDFHTPPVHGSPFACVT